MTKLHVPPRVGSIPVTATLRLRNNHRASPKASLSGLAATSHQVTWRRTSNNHHSWLWALFKGTPVVFAPLLSLSCFLALARYGGSLTRLFMATTEAGVLTVLRNHGPEITSEASLAVAFWLEIQAVFYRYLPGPRNAGQRTPAGHLLSYRTNGLPAWIITHAIFATLCCLGRVDPAFIPENTPKMQGAL
ncbi:hypothetical protein BDW60DRAFT_210399 [Aspergillus nidulans var. acristatus]